MRNKSAIWFLGKCFLPGLLMFWAVFSKAQEPLVKIMKWTVGDTVREAMVYLPVNAKTKDSPVIFVFHGHGGTMGNMFRSRSFEKLWPEAIVVCPQGLNTPGQLTDPNGRLPGWQKAPGDMGDRDLHFFDAMLKTLREDYWVDNKRIYATGHSNGGGFTYLLWATRGDIFAAFAPSSAVAAKVANLLKPKPAMHIMGEQDYLVKPTWQRAMYNKILQVNSCSDKGQPYDQYATLYPSDTQTPVVLYIHPGGHVYPVEANKVVIKFFKSIKKP
ncbi:prolyl oligopeptidase family serine peptidase [Pedobacter sp. HDW13]|uniref:alpha/beta hydrolase family esterase n=1 Tax=Pedobacter sp. HDW13 TaxID=2714940 RepID=UPI001409EA02|nr:prolyl oligopeptidase family serine peptidase [Pedobacter sp. HDW13]QIL38243.1 prolyl oligopeptidase family serine peptidase [Pedobacter sp. HDW13]